MEKLSKGQTILIFKEKVKNFIVPNLLIIKVSDWKKKKKVQKEIEKEIFETNI